MAILRRVICESVTAWCARYITRPMRAYRGSSLRRPNSELCELGEWCSAELISSRGAVNARELAEQLLRRTIPEAQAVPVPSGAPITNLRSTCERVKVFARA